MGVFGDQDGGVVPDLVAFVDGVEGDVLEGGGAELVAGREDDVVQGTELGEEGLDVFFEGGGAEVAGVAREAVFG